MKLPRILITAISSGSGKTTITCGILQALKNRGLKVSAFKCGPDYIDPMFHKTVLELPSKNLDAFLAKKEVLKELFFESAKSSDISVIEGVMGYYDGMAFDTEKASSYEVAKILNMPAIIVLNAKGMSLSAVAALKGFIDFKENSRIKGVILNRVTKMTYMQLKPVIEEQLGIKVLGFMPDSPACKLESRHLGLITPAELDDIKKTIEEISKLVEENIDIDMLIDIAKENDEFFNCFDVNTKKNLYSSSVLEINDKITFDNNNDNIKIAVAYDKAFCFYYEDNLNLLKKLGAKLEYFSPLIDKEIPKDCAGLLLGGGYPEIYAKQLSENTQMLRSIRNAIENKMPCVAECGGFLYLHREIEDVQHNLYKWQE